MNVYQFTYNGYYPVGACGVAFADDEDDAVWLASEAIKAHGQVPDGVVVKELTVLAQRDARMAFVILDGNY